MKLPKTNLAAKIGITTALVAFVVGASVGLSGASSSSKPQTLRLSDSTSSTPAVDTTTSPDGQIAIRGTSPNPSGGTTANDSQGSDPSYAAPTANDSGPAPADVPADQPDPITAVSVSMDPWTTPIPIASMGSISGVPQPTTESYLFCTYTYSDGSTKKALNQTKDVVGSGAQSMATIAPGPAAGCTMATAPSPN